MKKFADALWRFSLAAMSHGHGRMICLGFMASLIYLPFWLKEIGVAAARGSTAVLILCFVGLACANLFRDRRRLSQLKASEDEQVLGYILIVMGSILMPFCRFALWPQAVVLSIILSGMALSSWGFRFLQLQPVTTMLVFLSVYPRLGVTGRLVWETLTPTQFLERLMAWSGSVVLNLIGNPAVADGPYLSVAEGSVYVDWGCNGFSMAANMAAASLILGLFLKQSRRIVLLMMCIGAILALIANVPRIVLLTYAAVYWGKESFHFWHGPIGGQIFSGIMFTIYYYVVMWLMNRSSSPSTNNSLSGS